MTQTILLSDISILETIVVIILMRVYLYTKDLFCRELSDVNCMVRMQGLYCAKMNILNILFIFRKILSAALRPSAISHRGYHHMRCVSNCNLFILFNSFVASNKKHPEQTENSILFVLNFTPSNKMFLA